MQSKALIAFAAAAILLSSAASAQDFSNLTPAQIQQKRLDMESTKATLMARLNHADDFGQTEGLYVNVRTKAYDTLSGLPAKAGVCQGQAAAWLAKWDEILSTLNAVTSDNASTLADSLHTQMATQSFAYDQIRQTAQAIVTTASGLTTQASEIVAYPASYIPGYETHITAFNQRVAELRASLMQYQNEFGPSYFQNWQDTSTQTGQVVNDRLKAAMLHYPALQAELTLAGQAFQVSQTLDPAVATVAAAYDKYNSDFLAKRTFHADDDIQALQSAVHMATGVINLSGMDPMFTGPALDNINKKLAGAQKNAAVPSDFSKAQIVASYVHQQQILYSFRCRDPKQSPLYNCDLVRTLNHFDAPTVNAMGTADLRQLEYAFDKVSLQPTTTSASNGAKS